jgi:hypothetical protein
MTRSAFWDRVELTVGVAALVGFLAWWASLPGDCGCQAPGCNMPCASCCAPNDCPCTLPDPTTACGGDHRG